jgi:predicted PurR-regulated permease PerM
MGSMKLFQVGWVLFFIPSIIMWLLPPLRPWLEKIRTPESMRRATNMMVAVAAVGFFIYGIASFRQSVSNILSSGFMLLLFGATAGRIFALPGRWSSLMLAASFAYFATLAFRMTLDDKLVPNVPVVVVLAAVTVALVGWAIWLVIRQNAEQPVSIQDTLPRGVVT